jgi:serine/threonine protein phosphatase 1
MVFKRLFGLKQDSPDRAACIPEGQRIYAIGDVHGRLDLLDALIARIDADDAARSPSRTTLIFLGDLVDRGPESRAVVERVMQLKASRLDVRIIAGNHEEIVIRAWAGDKRSAGLLNKVGGRETLLSYGVSEHDYDMADLAEVTRLAGEHIPQDHIDFFSGAEDWIEAGDYLFVHAGIRPGYALAEQETSDLRWIRREFTEHRGDFGHVVIHGHSITENVDEQPNRIGIDTGAFATGKLTAIGLEGEDRWFLQT